jgi:murein DD-endopeptidase MepM/ murein hydrolase activator NlpD
MKRQLILTIMFLAALGGLGLLARLDAPQTGQVADAALGAGGPVEHLPPAPPLLPDPEPALVETGAAGPALGRMVDLRIQPRQTFYEALEALAIPHEDIMALVRSVKPFRDLRKVRQGEQFTVELSVRGELASFGFDLDLESWVRYQRQEDGTFDQELGTYPVEHRTVGISGAIETSLYESLQACGAPLNLAAKMNDVLGWDLDFTRDPRRGDTFRIVYEEIYKDGAFVRTGPILACRYQGAGRDLGAYRYTLRDGKAGYYDQEGKNQQKQLMRAPLNYSRISSNFSYNRRHPVLGRNMPHLGIDYAAPVGTPVWAAGDGTVVEMGRNKANGRYVRIRHTNREYETYYLHFSRFARGLAKGKHVRQGDVIGYVGATGYATGPHLDFRVKKSGTFVNPRKLKLPPAAPVPDTEQASYFALCHAYDTALAELAVDAPETPVAITALEEDAAPWWNPRSRAEREVPPLVRAAD